jgi:hypothetical protein
VDEPSAGRHKAVSTFQFEHAEIVVQPSPVGYIGRIERENDVDRPEPEYAGPLGRGTMLALAEVSW